MTASAVGLDTLVGASGAGKSALMQMVHGSHLAHAGVIRAGDLDVARARPREVLGRGLAHACPAFLLDEPTASLDAVNREVVLTVLAHSDQAPHLRMTAPKRARTGSPWRRLMQPTSPPRVNTVRHKTRYIPGRSMT